MQKKLITVSVPVYNEKENIRPCYDRISAVMQSLPAYDYEIVYFDDGSTDGSREEIEALCSADKRVKAVFYTRNFGYSKTVFYCMQQAEGDAAVLVHCDLQNPPEEIPRMIEKWEQGAEIVLGVKNKSKENGFVYFLRTLFYGIMNLLFGMKLVPHTTEFELFDKSFVRLLRQINAPNPFLRGIINEYGQTVEKIYYTQDRRAKGKSHFSIGKYYDFAVNGIVNTSRCLPRRILVFALSGLFAVLLEFLIHFVPHLAELDHMALWNGLLLRFGISVLLAGLAALAVMFEYVIAAARNSSGEQQITEEKRLNF